MAFLHSLTLAENYKIALEGYITVLDAVCQEIRVGSKKVRHLAEEDADTLLLMTIPGMGYYSALLTRSEIGEVRRFRSTKKRCACQHQQQLVMANGMKCWRFLSWT